MYARGSLREFWYVPLVLPWSPCVWDMMLLCDTTQLYFPDEQNASGHFFHPMKRFGLYKTLFKPYVKLLHFLRKNTYEVVNRNIGFYLHRHIWFYSLCKHNNCNNKLSCITICFELCRSSSGYSRRKCSVWLLIILTWHCRRLVCWILLSFVDCFLSCVFCFGTYNKQPKTSLRFTVASIWPIWIETSYYDIVHCYNYYV